MAIELEVVADGLQFPEGPVALADGSVLVVEIRRGTLTRIAPDGTATVVAECGGGPNGAALGPDGLVYVCNNGGFGWVQIDETTYLPWGTPDDYAGGSIQTVDPATGEVHDLYRACGGAQLRGPNDLVFDEHGGFYFTDHGKDTGTAVDWGAVYYAKADGSSITPVAQHLHGPNGVGLSPDGTRLYVAETPTGRVWWWDVTEPGVIQGGRTLGGSGSGNHLYSPTEFAMFDSLGVEASGNVCVATLVLGGISVVSPEGELVDFVDTGDPATTNICWGGSDLATAYVTSSGRGQLLRATWPRPGLPLPHSQV
jgi:gluconolactonase